MIVFTFPVFFVRVFFLLFPAGLLYTCFFFVVGLCLSFFSVELFLLS